MSRDRTKAHQSGFRLKRFAKVKAMIEAIIARKGSCRILDVGGEFDYWKPFLDQIEGLPIDVTIANIDDVSEQFSDPRFTSCYGNACDLSFAADNSYDFAHSNSVIEHVGRWPEMRAMAREVSRVAPAYYVQTPYYWFPLEPHFRTIGYQWLPESWRARLHTRFSLGYFPKARDFEQGMAFALNAVLIDRLQLQVLFPDGAITHERVMGLTKSLVVTREG